MALGAHGEICERVNGEWKITIRSDPTVWNLEEVAEATYNCLHGYSEAWEGDGESDEWFLEKCNNKKTLVSWLKDWVVGYLEMNPHHYPNGCEDWAEDRVMHTLRRHILMCGPAFGNPSTVNTEEE